MAFGVRLGFFWGGSHWLFTDQNPVLDLFRQTQSDQKWQIIFGNPFYFSRTLENTVFSDTSAWSVDIFAHPGCHISVFLGCHGKSFPACPREQHQLSLYQPDQNSAEAFLQLLVWISCFAWGENRILIWLGKNQNSDFHLSEHFPWTDKSTVSSL